MVHEESKSWNKGDGQADFYEQNCRASKKNPLARNLMGFRGKGRMKKIIKPHEMPWENSRHGRIKHLINERMAEDMDVPVKSVDLYIQEIPPGGRSGKHRHMSEECIYVLEGKGYDMHWDVDVKMGDEYSWKVSEDGKRHDWEESDMVYIPINTVHQHFNADADKPARIISAVCRIYNHLGYGYNDLEQLENAPDYKSKRKHRI